MNTVSVQFPDSVTSVFGDNDPGTPILSAAVVKWYELGRISQGKAAELLGISRVEFLELLSAFKVSAWQYTEDELTEELALD
ncbi:MAG TPA: UPF0175 family protein [Pyrinomonadaceae bacterium]|nr:UPF0175 family protein [Pyrinomonadaceae bacterium]